MNILGITGFFIVYFFSVNKSGVLDPELGDYKPFKRKRREYTSQQKADLELAFNSRISKHLDKEEISVMAQKLGIEEERVKRWFSHRRIKWKKGNKSQKLKKKNQSNIDPKAAFNPNSFQHRLLKRSLIAGK